jgi:hypothetical protein
MKRIVLSEAGLALTSGSIAGLIIGLIHPSVGVTYLIAFGVIAIGLGILIGPELVQLRRERHGSFSTHRGGGGRRS